MVLVAYDLDGIDDVLGPGTITAIDSGDWTIAQFVNPDSAGEGDNANLVMVRSAATNNIHRLHWQTATLTLRCAQRYSTTVASSTTVETVATGAFSVVVGTFRASDAKCRVYLGDLDSPVVEVSYVAQVAGVGTRTTGANTLRIGNVADGTLTFDGRIASTVFDAREWTLDEMEGFRLTGVPPLASTLRGWWPLEDSARDCSGQGVDLTVTGAVLAASPGLQLIQRPRPMPIMAPLLAS